MLKKEVFFILFIQLLLTRSALAECSAHREGEDYYRRPNQLISQKQQLKAQAKSDYLNHLRARSRFFAEKNGYYTVNISGEKIILPKKFFQLLAAQLEYAFKKGLVDEVYYSDLGHAHVLIPTAKNKKKSSYQEVLSSLNFKLLYHTAELFNFSILWDDKKRQRPVVSDLKWMKKRFLERNLISHHLSKEYLEILPRVPGRYNTVRKIKGYRQLLTLYVIPNVNGCFSFSTAKGRRSFFDVSIML